MQSKPVISVVDDDRSVRESTSALIRSLGYRTATFESAQAFLESADRDRTSYLIADVQMPGMTGIELYRRLIDEGFNIPVVFITGFAENVARAHTLAPGAIGFLTKPFDEESLIQCLQAALPDRAC